MLFVACTGTVLPVLRLFIRSLQRTDRFRVDAICVILLDLTLAFVF